MRTWRRAIKTNRFDGEKEDERQLGSGLLGKAASGVGTTRRHDSLVLNGWGGGREGERDAAHFQVVGKGGVRHGNDEVARELGIGRRVQLHHPVKRQSDVAAHLRESTGCFGCKRAAGVSTRDQCLGAVTGAEGWRPPSAREQAVQRCLVCTVGTCSNGGGQPAEPAACAVSTLKDTTMGKVGVGWGCVTRGCEEAALVRQNHRCG